jgi:hypothetical protein
MSSEDKITGNIDTWLTWLKRAAFAGIFFFSLILVSYTINFGSVSGFSEALNRISKSPSDWSSFGSLLSGASSFLGAIGTVGVMLLGIKQFKIQQEQISKQTERQDTFEKNQSDIWKRENEVLNFKKFNMHLNLFKEEMSNFEKQFNIYHINNYNKLYKYIFPNNSIEKTTFRVTGYKENKKLNNPDFIFSIIQKIQSIHNLNRDDPLFLNYLHNITHEILKLLCVSTSKQEPLSNGLLFISGDNVGLNMNEIYFSLHSLTEFINLIIQFSSYEKEGIEELGVLHSFNQEKSFTTLTHGSAHITYRIDESQVNFPIILISELRRLKLTPASQIKPYLFNEKLNDIIDSIYDAKTSAELRRIKNTIQGFQKSYASLIQDYNVDLIELTKVSLKEVKRNI